MKGAKMTRKIQPPEKEWLEKEWLLPPNGKGRGSPDIAKELGVDKRTVLRWLERYEIKEDGKRRLSIHRQGKATWSKERPPMEELAYLYLMPPVGQGKTIEWLATQYQVSFLTVRRWLKHYKLSQTFSDRHSQRMAGAGNASYKDGSSRRGQKNALLRSGRICKCAWCGTIKKVQLHHIDHNVENGELSNLEWLCFGCNRLESALWVLSDRSIYTLIEDSGIVRELHIKFK
jgi:transposase